MALKTDYKDYVYSGSQKFKITSNSDGTSSITDSTTYSQIGDSFGASDLNATNKAVNKVTPTTYSNITVSVTPTALSSYCAWDTEQKYGYSATITVSGVTENSLIQNIVMTDTLLSAIANVVTTTTNGLVFYTEDETALSGVIYTLVTSEVNNL